MPIVQRRMMTLAAVLMLIFAIATAIGGYVEHSAVVVAFQLFAAALLLYWAKT